MVRETSVADRPMLVEQDWLKAKIAAHIRHMKTTVIPHAPPPPPPLTRIHHFRVSSYQVHSGLLPPRLGRV